MVRICIQILRTPFDWFKFGFKCFESLSNRLNLRYNALNAFQMVRICIRIPSEWLEFGFKSSNSFRLVWIFIRMLWTPFEWFEFGIECFEFLLNSLNLHSNAFWIVRSWIWMCGIWFEWLEFAFEFLSNASNSFRMLRISFECFKQLLNAGFKCFKLAFESIECLSNG